MPDIEEKHIVGSILLVATVLFFSLAVYAPALGLSMTMHLQQIPGSNISVNPSSVWLSQSLTVTATGLPNYVPAYVMYQKVGVDSYQSATNSQTSTNGVGVLQVTFSIGPPNLAGTYDVWAIDGSTATCFDRSCAATNIVQVTVQGGHPTISSAQSIIRPADSQSSPTYLTISGSGFVPNGVASFVDLNCWGSCTGYRNVQVDATGSFSGFQDPIGLGYASVIQSGTTIGIVAIDSSVQPFGMATSNTVNVLVCACGNPQWGSKGTISITSTTLHLGDTPTISGSGFTSGSQVAIRLYTEPYPPAALWGGSSATADGSGSWVNQQSIGSSWPSQTYIDAVDISSCGHSNILTVTVSAQPPPPPPATIVTIQTNDQSSGQVLSYVNVIFGTGQNVMTDAVGHGSVVLSGGGQTVSTSYVASKLGYSSVSGSVTATGPTSLTISLVPTVQTTTSVDPSMTVTTQTTSTSAITISIISTTASTQTTATTFSTTTQTNTITSRSAVTSTITSHLLVTSTSTSIGQFTSTIVVSGTSVMTSVGKTTSAVVVTLTSLSSTIIRTITSNPPGGIPTNLYQYLFGVLGTLSGIGSAVVFRRS